MLVLTSVRIRCSVVVVVVTFLVVVVAPLTDPFVIGWPPLVVGTMDGAGVALGLGETEGVGVDEARGVGLTLAVGNTLENKVLTPRNVATPTITRIMTVKRPTINCFICPILYATLSNFGRNAKFEFRI